MKRLALAAIVLTLAACSSQEETPATDSAVAAPAAAPAPTMAPDSATMAPMPMDTTHMDSTTDTTAH